MSSVVAKISEWDGPKGNRTEFDIVLHHVSTSGYNKGSEVFDDATRHAHSVMEALKVANPRREYTLKSIETDNISIPYSRVDGVPIFDVIRKIEEGDDASETEN